jgi:aspartyl-tRNA(Asn)/glutamyl-tRNA(Gln) amidotransferase subunit B
VDEAVEYLKDLRAILMWLGVNDGNLEEGSFRCDANVSIRPRGSDTLGTRVELKNINSFRFVEKAIAHEVARQEALAESNVAVQQETRGWDEKTGGTFSLRSKEEAEDYRYFPEPDLVPVAPPRAWVEELRAALPELPLVRRTRLLEEWGISATDMQAILNAGALDPIVATIEAGADSASARKWWMGELARHANESGKGLDELSITPEQVARVTKLVSSGDLNDKLARQVIEGVLAGEGTPDEVVDKRGLKVVSDEGALTTAVEEAIAGNPAIADKIRGGKVAAAGALVGAVMKATRGQADAARVKELILEKLGVSEG